MSQLNSAEQSVFRDLASSAQGQILAAYFERVVAEMVDLRKLPKENREIAIEGRTLFAQLVEEHITSRIKVSSNKTYEKTDAFD